MSRDETRAVVQRLQEIADKQGQTPQDIMVGVRLLSDHGLAVSHLGGHDLVHSLWRQLVHAYSAAKCREARHEEG